MTHDKILKYVANYSSWISMCRTPPLPLAISSRIFNSGDDIDIGDDTREAGNAERRETLTMGRVVPLLVTSRKIARMVRRGHTRKF